MDLGPLIPAWLAALTAAGELRLVDVSTILADGHDGLLDVLHRRCGALVRRESVWTAGGRITIYLHGGDSPTPEQPHNACAQQLLLRFGLGLGYCPGTVLFIGGTFSREAGLTPAQVDLLRREHQSATSSLSVAAESHGVGPHRSMISP